MSADPRFIGDIPGTGIVSTGRAVDAAVDIDRGAPHPLDGQPEVRDAHGELEAAEAALHKLHGRAIAGDDVTPAEESEARSRVRLAELGIARARRVADERLQVEHAKAVEDLADEIRRLFHADSGQERIRNLEEAAAKAISDLYAATIEFTDAVREMASRGDGLGLTRGPVRASTGTMGQAIVAVDGVTTMAIDPSSEVARAVATGLGAAGARTELGRAVSSHRSTADTAWKRIAGEW